MDLFINKLISAMMQLALVGIVPLIWWLVSARKRENFFQWIGLKRVIPEKGLYKLFWIVTFVYLAVGTGMLFMLRGVAVASSEFSGLGVTALPAALVYSFLITGCSEEIFFRGFILKRISSRFGFPIGNAVQAVLFGLMHGVMLFRMVGPIQVLIITASTGLVGWFMGYINEKKAHGSILPSWAMHGLCNLVSSILALFSIL